MGQQQTSTVLEPDTKKVTAVKYHPRWRVLGLNDDVTTMEYVVFLLMEVFRKNSQTAYQLMMEVHHKGMATFYVGTREACELKLEQVKDYNREFNQKLQVRMEPIEDEG